MQNLNASTLIKFIKSFQNRFFAKQFSKPYSNYIERNVNVVQSLRILKNKNNFFKTAGAAITGSLFYGWVQGGFSPLRAMSKSLKELVQDADRLYDELKFEEIYNLLIVEKDCKDDEVLWRLARATYEKSRKEEKEKKALLFEALQYLNLANELNENNFAVHKWLAIIMDSYYSLEGTKQRIEHLFDMKMHMEKACELKPKDGTSFYVLGMWYFGIANISWYERKAAALFFASPPQATYQDALDRFLEAERVEPGFYSQNYVMIGKCLHYLGRKEESKEFFSKAKNYSGKTQDDREAREEAIKWIG